MQATATYHDKLLDFIISSYSHITLRATLIHHITLHNYTKILLKFVYFNTVKGPLLHIFDDS